MARLEKLEISLVRGHNARRIYRLMTVKRHISQSPPIEKIALQLLGLSAKLDHLDGPFH